MPPPGSLDSARFRGRRPGNTPSARVATALTVPMRAGEVTRRLATTSAERQMERYADEGDAEPNGRGRSGRSGATLGVAYCGAREQALAEAPAWCGGLRRLGQARAAAVDVAAEEWRATKGESLMTGARAIE